MVQQRVHVWGSQGRERGTCANMSSFAQEDAAAFMLLAGMMYLGMH
ncbi:unnamed protein product, partial [Ectocarpus sp. 13 AM-2016]